ncbi:MAG: hypothetical protein LW832_08495 [Parachlamydia sp.]|nr:hypothetical protein [Parachlamydia sp.]
MEYKNLLLDIGGVLGTNGWDRHMRAQGIRQFGLNSQETEKRHALIFDTYEIGKLTDVK